MAGKTLVTGGSGFLGSHLVRALAARGDELRLLARRGSELGHLGDIEFERATGDVTDRRAVRRAMDGVDRVFHVAGRTSLRAADREAVFAANLRGARMVFECGARGGGDARRPHLERRGDRGREAAWHRRRVDPVRDRAPRDHLRQLQARGRARGVPPRRHGLPVVIVNPTFVLGPDDPTRTSMGLVRRFCLGQIPAYVEGALNIVDVRDVATGHLLADERGEAGERYILGGRNFTFDRLFADLARISGVDPPPLKLPTRVAIAGARGGHAAWACGPPSPPEEIVSASQWWTYRNAKAKRELGFAPRPHEETLEDAVSWQLAELGGRRPGRSPERLALRALGRAARAVSG